MLEAHRITRTSLAYWKETLANEKINYHHNLEPKVGMYVCIQEEYITGLFPTERQKQGTMVHIYYVVTEDALLSKYDAELVWKRSFAGPRYILKKK